MARPLRILIVSTELDPIASTGELGRSVGGLAKALKGLRVDVRVVMPRYPRINTNLFNMVRLVEKVRIQTFTRFGDMSIWRDEIPGEVPVYLLEKEKYFDRDYIYGEPGQAYQDNAERFSFLSLAALEILAQIGFYPDVIHCHDWHTGLIPAYLKTVFHKDPLYSPIKTVFTIHNLIYQGRFSREALSVTGLPDTIYTPEGIEFYEEISFLKAGLIYADILTTESKRYSHEIQTKEYGRGFEGIFQQRSKDLYGIINGVEYKQYDPRLDPYILANYTKDEMEKKQSCKRDLLETCGFAQCPDMPVVGMIAAFEQEKGVDLLIETLDDMLNMYIRFVFLQEGHAQNDMYINALRELTEKHHARFKYYLTDDLALKHKILAGADILLIPSRSEPSGVLQLYALKYGTIPVVRATGGLDDTVVEFQPESGKGTGFKFTEYTPASLLAKLRDVLIVYHNESLWDLLRANAMRVDYSWVYTAKKYVKIYKLAIERTRTLSGTKGEH